MNRLTALALSASIVVLGAALLADAGAQTAPGSSAQGQAATGTKPRVVARSAKVTATVEEIDYASRTARLRGEGGREVVIKAPKEAVNFDQVKKGDRVVAEVLEETAIFVVSADAAGSGSSGGAAQPSADQVEVVGRAQPGQMPAVGDTTVTQITATVEEIDYPTRVVTLKGPLGNLRTLTVGDDVKNLESVKKGDMVVLRHTEALLLKVER
jgi:hypothetical protein